MIQLHIPNLIEKIPQDIKDDMFHIIDFLSQEYNAYCMLTGGAVRDMLLDREVYDIDLECYGIDEDSFSQAMDRLNAQGVGKSFFVYKIGSIDIALPRVEKKVAKGHRGFSVAITTDEKEASKRRDFTINALLYEPKRGILKDYWGGLRDIESKTLRVVSSDTFIEDSLRVLRAMQFSARLAFKIDRDSCRLCKSIDLDDLAGARIFLEFEKMFKSDYPHYGLYALESMDISQKLWGVGLSKEALFRAMRDFIKFRDNFDSDMREFYFLAIYMQYSSQDIETILSKISAPNRYKRVLLNLPKIPTKITPSFVASLAKKDGVSSHAYGYHSTIRDIAKSIGVWDKPFDIGVTPTELMERGFRGKELGEELERIRRERLLELDNLLK